MRVILLVSVLNEILNNNNKLYNIIIITDGTMVNGDIE